MELVAQIIGILGMTSNIISYQFKRRVGVLICLLMGGVLFAINMFMLGAIIGGILNILSVIRSPAYMNLDKRPSQKNILNALFIVLFIVSYIFTFTLFGKEATLPNLVLELLPVIGSIALTVSFSMNTSRAIRIAGFISSPCWLIYNCFVFSIGGILCEVISLISIITAVIRLDRQGSQSGTKEAENDNNIAER